MAVRSYLFGEELPQPKISTGIALRYHEEVFVDGADSDTIQEYFTKGVVRPWY